MKRSFTSQQIDTANSVNLKAVLQSLNYENIGNSIFQNPLKVEENSNSFSVFQKKNSKIWCAKDHGQNKVWNNITLIREIKNYSFVEAVKFLLDFDGQFVEEENAPCTSSFQNPHSNSNNVLPAQKECLPKQIANLNYYLKIDRCISPTIAKEYIEYNQFLQNEKWNYGLFFKNDKGGYALRNKLHKRNFGSAGITTLKLDNCQTWCVFEGFLDYLSAITFYKKKFKANILVLNSTSMIEEAKKALQDNKATKIFTFLDNDTAGKTATNELRKLDIELIDKSVIYQQHNDFNDFLIYTKRN